MTTIDQRVPAYLGRVLSPQGQAVATCFQVIPAVLVTAYHVLNDLDAAQIDALVEFDSLDGAVSSAEARVARLDPLHDLAILVCTRPLAGSAAGLAATDAVGKLTELVVTGVPDVNDPGHKYEWLDTTGTWQGGAMRDREVRLGRMTSPGVVPGMSGAPVRRLSDDVVIGVISARYNSVDGWLRDSVWVARTEHLQDLLDGVQEDEDRTAAMQQVRRQMSDLIPGFDTKFPEDFRDKLICDVRDEKIFTLRTARALVFGRTGVGKTTTINYLLEAPVFPATGQLTCTRSLAAGEHRNGLIFYDSPGLGDEPYQHNVTCAALGLPQIDDEDGEVVQ